AGPEVSLSCISVPGSETVGAPPENAVGPISATTTRHSFFSVCTLIGGFLLDGRSCRHLGDDPPEATEHSRARQGYTPQRSDQGCGGTSHWDPRAGPRSGSVSR